LVFIKGGLKDPITGFLGLKFLKRIIGSHRDDVFGLFFSSFGIYFRGIGDDFSLRLWYLFWGDSVLKASGGFESHS